MKKNIKRCLSFLLCATLLFCGTAFAADSGISLDPAKVQAGKVVVTGKTAQTDSYVVLRVTKPDITLENAASLNDYLYIGESIPDANGSFTFAFPIENNEGKFEMEATVIGSDIKAESDFTFKPNRDSSIKSFQIGGKTASINGTSISVTVSSSMNIQGLIATFTLAEGATAHINGVKQQSGVTRNDFSNTLYYDVTADDGTQNRYAVTVTKESGTQGGGSGTGSSNGGDGFISPGKDNPTVPEVIPDTFVDVSKSHWAYDAVEKMAAKGVIKGYEDGSFHPDSSITREEFVKVLVNYFDLVPQGNTVSFADVDKNEWYAYYIDIAVGNGIIKGISDSKFGVGQNISRQDMAVMLERVVSAKGITVSPIKEKIDFNDGSTIASYALKAIEKFQTAGIINGYEDGTFRPDDSAARAEVCAMLAKLK